MCFFLTLNLGNILTLRVYKGVISIEDSKYESVEPYGERFDVLSLPTKMGSNFGRFFFQFFLFHAKSGTTNNHRNVSSDKSYQRFFNRDSNEIKIFSKSCPSVEKNWFEVVGI